MFRPCWVIFREKPSIVVTLCCTIRLSKNVLLTVHSQQHIIDEEKTLCAFVGVLSFCHLQLCISYYTQFKMVTM
jgi:hypothetical protein